MSKRRARIKAKARNLIKDKTLVKFILQHSVKEDIDFSKITIPSFSDVLKSDEEDSRSFRAKYINIKNGELNSQTIKGFPTFTLSLLDIV